MGERMRQDQTSLLGGGLLFETSFPSYFLNRFVCVSICW